MYYSAVNYWTPGWVSPRLRVREPFPRRSRRLPAFLFSAASFVANPVAGWTVRLVPNVFKLADARTVFTSDARP